MHDTLNRVTLCLDPYDESTWTTCDVANVCEYLLQTFGKWPDTARLYIDNVSKETDITPTTPEAVERLQAMRGHFYVVVYPAEIVTALYFIIAAVVVVAVVLATRKIPNVAARNSQNTSPNNELTARTNTARPNARIPDIFGKVRSIPDLVAATYLVFDPADDNLEVEHSLMCIGRGEYAIEDVRDGETLFSEIDGASAKFYAPGTSPASGSPFMTIGDTFTEPVYATFRSSAVIGQELLSPNSGTIVGDSNIGYTDQMAIFTTDSNIDFTDSFSPLEDITLQNARWAGLNLDGTYLIASVSVNRINLASPATLNPNWNSVPTGNTSRDTAPRLYQQFNRDIGPYVIEGPAGTSSKIVCNFVAPNGLYKDDGKTQYRVVVSVLIGIQPIDASGANVGGETINVVALVGSSQSRKSIGVTMTMTLAGSRFKVRAVRTSNSDFAFDGVVTDEVRWRDLYLQKAVTQDFGDVTLVQTKVRAVPGALAVKDRKFNALVTRKLPQRISGSTFGTTLVPTTLGADIISHLCFDPKIGNRPRSEVDHDGIYNIFLTQMPGYFGTHVPEQFSYTFDSTDLSAEESIQAVAQACFCTAYRRGSVIKLFFERSQASSVLLFNHRNKIPRTEQRVNKFGVIDGYDGVELTYVDPENNDAVSSLFFPDDLRTKYRKVETIGVRDIKQARLHGWREYQRMRYTHTTVTFEALSEAEIVVAGQRVAVANNVRPNTQDGEVVSQAGLILTLSQDVDLTGGGYVILLQLRDGTTQAIDVTPGTAPNRVVLAEAPALTLVLTDDRFAHTLYTIVKGTDAESLAFIMTDRAHKGGMVHEVTAINYDARYFAHDQDFAEVGLLSGGGWDDGAAWDDLTGWTD